MNTDNLVWRKSSRSGPWTDNCVEVAFVNENTVCVRDSKNPAAAFQTYNKAEWDAFVDGVKLGEFDLA